MSERRIGDGFKNLGRAAGLGVFSGVKYAGSGAAAAIASIPAGLLGGAFLAMAKGADTFERVGANLRQEPRDPEAAKDAADTIRLGKSFTKVGFNACRGGFRSGSEDARLAKLAVKEAVDAFKGGED